MTDEYIEVVINWSVRNSWKEYQSDLANVEKCLYSIYCDSHIYGNNVLAYIGQTSRSINERLSEHERSFFMFAQNVSFSIGKIDERCSLDLETIESILVANHKPFFNKNYIHNLNLQGRKKKILIINNGNHGSLKSCCTNYWWCETK